MGIDQIKGHIAHIESGSDALEKGEGVNPEVIVALENAFGGWLPNSYKEFLAVFGWLGRGDAFISGITEKSNLRFGRGDALFDTEILRAEGGLPDGLVVIQKHDDGAYCLDLNTRFDNECAVVNFEHGWNKGIVVARTFTEWMVTFYLHPDDLGSPP